MNNSLNEKLNLYYKEISDCVLCSKKKKNTLLREIKNDVCEYTEQFPDAGIEEIISVFGTPEEIANGIGISYKEIKSKLDLRRLLIYFLLAGLLIWGIFAVISFIDVHSEAHGYFSESVLSIYNVWGGDLL